MHSGCCRSVGSNGALPQTTTAQLAMAQNVAISAPPCISATSLTMTLAAAEAKASDDDSRTCNGAKFGHLRIAELEAPQVGIVSLVFGVAGENGQQVTALHDPL